MRNGIAVMAALLLVVAGALSLGGCSCGFDCTNEDTRGITQLTLGLSDALPEDLKQVVLEIDSISTHSTTPQKSMRLWRKYTNISEKLTLTEANAEGSRLKIEDGTRLIDFVMNGL